MYRLRMRLVAMSASSAGLLGVFILLAPLLGYPLRYPDEPVQLAQQILPIFIGYLVAAVRFFTVEEEGTNVGRRRVATLEKLLNWSFLLFTILFVTLLFAFGFSNSRYSPLPPGSGMGLQAFSLYLTLLLSLLTGTVGYLSTFLFSTAEKPTKRSPV